MQNFYHPQYDSGLRSLPAPLNSGILAEALWLHCGAQRALGLDSSGVQGLRKNGTLERAPVLRLRAKVPENGDNR